MDLHDRAKATYAKTGDTCCDSSPNRCAYKSTWPLFVFLLHETEEKIHLYAGGNRFKMPPPTKRKGYWSRRVYATRATLNRNRHRKGSGRRPPKAIGGVWKPRLTMPAGRGGCVPRMAPSQKHIYKRRPSTPSSKHQRHDHGARAGTEDRVTPDPTTAKRMVAKRTWRSPGKMNG
ncbi:hypothetical protein FNV43_RR14495 [Rhamnella rubrinervis]|uniref:Uncharacterized protein n=1 Tax=Rhamnella rubrinervis TaxID=2594499 RepID=A0A8K0MGD4_9ROSA|nr:hypothetical protein FNV43_RR14495 [Rhamnella rubrinervis]